MSYFNWSFSCAGKKKTSQVVKSTVSQAEKAPSSEKQKLLNTSLNQAVRERNVSEVKSLIAEKADMESTDEKGNTALNVALGEKPNEEVALVLIEAGANLEAEDHFGVKPLTRATVRRFKKWLNS